MKALFLNIAMFRDIQYVNKALIHPLPLVHFFVDPQNIYFTILKSGQKTILSINCPNYINLSHSNSLQVKHFNLIYVIRMNIIKLLKFFLLIVVFW